VILEIPDRLAMARQDQPVIRVILGIPARPALVIQA
jgi:hypothetical protein